MKNIQPTTHDGLRLCGIFNEHPLSYSLQTLLLLLLSSLYFLLTFT